MTKYVSDEDLQNRFGFHPATEQTRPLHESTREIFLEVAEWINDNIPEGREKSLALTNLQEAAMWCNAGIACNLAPLEQR